MPLLRQDVKLKIRRLARPRAGENPGWLPEASPNEWIVAKICSEHLQYCESRCSQWHAEQGPPGYVFVDTQRLVQILRRSFRYEPPLTVGQCEAGRRQPMGRRR